MATRAPKNVAFKFSVCFEKRPDGGLRACSDDVPGFVLSGKNCDAVLADVEPVLEVILSDMFNANIRVTPVRNLRDRLVDAGMVTPKRRVVKQEYVTQVAV